MADSGAADPVADADADGDPPTDPPTDPLAESRRLRCEFRLRLPAAPGSPEQEGSDDPRRTDEPQSSHAQPPS